MEKPGFLSDHFNRFLVLLLAVAAAYSLAFIPTVQPVAPQQYGQESCSSALEVHFFYLPSCPHCKLQMPLNQQLAEEFPCATWRYHNVEEKPEQQLLLSLQAPLGVEGMHTPTTIINETILVGFDPQETPQLLRNALSGSGTPLPSAPSAALNLPLIGKLNPADYSLPALSLILGLIDGFNPCAMWVLVYLISITLTLHDRRRFLLVVGTFLLASGILYFLIMAAWLNAFLFVGYLRPVMILVGAAAVGWGVLSIREFWRSRGKIECKVGDLAQKRKLTSEIDSLLHSPLTIATFAGLVMLAFTVNSIEFVCSSAIPAVFTQVLAIAPISPLEHYFYIFIYVVMYMLDDIIVFSLAYFAVGGALGDRVASYGHAIGAVILIALGLALLFAPGLLMA